jgi:hypothetical protein
MKNRGKAKNGKAEFKGEKPLIRNACATGWQLVTNSISTTDQPLNVRRQIKRFA